MSRAEVDEQGLHPASERERIERVSREFATLYHDLRDQTFATTTWLGVPLIKTPNDILVMQQIVAETRPELIVETGVYVGGSALLFASLQEALGIEGKVIAVDIDLSFVHERCREHPRIELIEGSSTDPTVVERITREAEGKRTMVDLDADHRGHHVLEELRTYADIVSPNCYLVVEDGWFGGRPVRDDAVPGPSEALDAWLAEGPPFEPDRWRERYLLTQNPRGYLRRVPEGGGPPVGPERPHSFVTGAFEAAAETQAPARDLEEPRPDQQSDREIEALRRTVGNLSRESREAEQSIDKLRTRSEIETENLLREIETQRELLAERTHQLAIARAQVQRVERTVSYRIHMKLRRLPLIRRVTQRQDRRAQAAAAARRAHRDEVRAKRVERYVTHSRGQ